MVTLHTAEDVSAMLEQSKDCEVIEIQIKEKSEGSDGEGPKEG